MVDYYEHRGMKILELDLSDPDTSLPNAIDDSKKMKRLAKLHRSGDLYTIYNIGEYKLEKELLTYAVHSIQEMRDSIKRRAIIVKSDAQKDRMVAICKALKIMDLTKIVETKEQALNWFIYKDDSYLNSLIIQ